MASGDLLAEWTALGNEPPAANYATLNARNVHPVLEFDATADEQAVFTSILPPHYSGGGITATLIWVAATATSGDVVWTAAFERQADGGTDIDADSFATANSVTSTAPGTSGVPKYATIAFTNSELDGLVVNERYRLKITRDADNASDTMASDSQLLALFLRET